VLIDGDLADGSMVRRNRFLNETGQAVPFIVNWSNGGPGCREPDHSGRRRNFLRWISHASRQHR
jgi:hypothetical protein